MKSFLPLIQSEWRLLLFGFAMAFGSSLGQTYFIGLFSGEIRLGLGLSHGAFGGIYSAATVATGTPTILLASIFLRAKPWGEVASNGPGRRLSATPRSTCSYRR